MSFTDIDLEVVRFFNVYFSIYLAYFSIFIIYSVYIYLISISYILFKIKRHNKLFHLFTVAAIGYILILSLKYLVGRPRPYEADPSINVVFKKTDPSFPSSHAFISYLSFFFIPESLPKWLKHILIIYLLVLIPISSLYSGVHYPSDLIVGALIGLILPGVLTEKISTRILEKIFR